MFNIMDKSRNNKTNLNESLSSNDEEDFDPFLNNKDKLNDKELAAFRKKNNIIIPSKTNFELVNTVQIMNNKASEDKTVDSNLQKQIIKYDSTSTPVFGMRFMYRPDNGKLIYSRGRIFLIFADYNHFLDSWNSSGIISA